MSSVLSQVCTYYRACYRADNREISIPNFLSKKIENRYFIENTDLIEGHMPMHPVSDEWFEATQKNLKAYEKEKELYMASHFLLGYGAVAGTNQRIFAPLFLHPASLLIENEEFYVQIDIGRRIFNPTFVRLLKSEETDEADVYEHLLQATPEGFVDFANNTEIKNALFQNFPELDMTEMQVYPDTADEETVKRFLTTSSRKKNSVFKVVPVQMLGVLRKSVNTLGVLNEIGEIATEEEFSKPLRTIFLQEKEIENTEKNGQIFVPVTLNAAQTDLFNAVRRHAVSYVVGPPGTGKSFTIAALAIDYLSRGKSVLIASSNNQAVDVIADKIERDFGLEGVVIRGGRQDYKKQLKERLQALLSGMTKFKANLQIIKSLERKATRLHKRIEQAEVLFQKREQSEIKRSQQLEGEGFLAAMQQWWIKTTTSTRDTLWRMLNDYQRDLDDYNATIKRLVRERFDRQLHRALQNDRQQLAAFDKAIRARTATRKELLFQNVDFDKLTNTFPIWLVSLSEVSNVLPLHREMFDLVIIDEATQCDTATAIPVLQRARKVVVSGDPKQLRHVSFLSRNRQEVLQQQHGLEEFDSGYLNYRAKSLLDVVSDSIQQQSQVAFLNEHYRSFPHIIDFSNQAFYSNSLHIIKSTPQTQREERVFVHRCQGIREKQGYNEAEVEALLIKVKEIIEQDKKLPKGRCRSIGILSPFREQVNRIVQRVQLEVNFAAIEKHQLLTGTAHSFQGEERDVMLLSFALDNEAHPTAFRHLNRDDVFNVSITRAKTEQHIYISAENQGLKNNTLLARYLQHVENFTSEKTNTHTNNEKDKFLNSVLLEIRKLGIEETYTAYPVAGIDVDLLIIRNGVAFCIDLIGYSDEYAEAFPIERYKMLNRVGIKVFPLPYTVWHFYRDVTLKALRSFFSPA